MVIGIVVAIAIVAVVFFIGLPMMKSGQKSAGIEPAKLTSAGTVMRTPAAEVRQTGRDSMGVRLVNLDEGVA